MGADRDSTLIHRAPLWIVAPPPITAISQVTKTLAITTLVGSNVRVPTINSPSNALRIAAFAIPFAGMMTGLFFRLKEYYPALDSLVVPIGLGAVPLCALRLFTRYQSKRGSEGWLDARELGLTVFIGLCVDRLALSVWVPYLNGALDFGESTSAFGTVEEIANSSKGGPRRRLVLEKGAPTVEFYPDPYWSVGNVRSGGPVRVKIGHGVFGARYVRSFADGA